MRVLSLLVICSLFLLAWLAGHPHGPGFKAGCDICHGTADWSFDREGNSFNHDTTLFRLEGQHSTTDCRLCHPTLVFAEAESECIGCHTDLHQGTTGNDCSRCHTPVSWLVPEITAIHQMGRFPLFGAHRTADCYECHKSENPVRFDVLGVECIDCHRPDYIATTTPVHIDAGFAEDCTMCHSMNAFQWQGAGFSHNFFPLTLGHALPACADCHQGGNYGSASPACFSCHSSDYNSTTNPGHVSLNFPTDCNTCHTTNPGWQPASYAQHDALSFPIYSGRHKGEWTSCTQCHTNPSSYAQFTCLSCHAHNKADMDSRHREEAGYVYDSNACLNCHPRGTSED